jgi:hypothetical protein
MNAELESIYQPNEDVSDVGLEDERRAAWIERYLGAGAVLHR